MGKSKKRASTAHSTVRKPHSPNAPRLDRNERQLSRFYEPLVLMHTLRSVRKELTRSELFSHFRISELPIRDVRRQFLADLAYVCDYEKGGDTVTAIGLQSTPQGYVYWVAANTCPDRKIVPFLDRLLKRLQIISRDQNTPSNNADESLAETCIQFSTRRIKDYRSLLRPLLARCTDYLDKTKSRDCADLLLWLRAFGNQELEPVELCRLAHRSRHGRFMRQIAELSVAPPYKSSDDAIHNDFQLVRHYIGRLGYHIRAAKALVNCAPRLISLLDVFDVQSIPTPPRAAGLPPIDGKTRLDSMIVRMLPALSPDVPYYQEAVAQMDLAYNLTTRVLESYENPNIRPRVHAEIQVLGHFHEKALAFEDDDRYIACSKPACYCCWLYFRHHRGHFEEPASHGKLYLNWHPPGFNLQPESSDAKSREQRDILQKMTTDIRSDLLHQISQNQAAHAWHPDSVTAITESIRLEDIFETTTNRLDVTSSSQSSISYSATEDRTLLSDSSHPTSVVNKPLSQLLSSDLDDPDFDSDADSEGGVPVNGVTLQ